MEGKRLDIGTSVAVIGTVASISFGAVSIINTSIKSKTPEKTPFCSDHKDIVDNLYKEMKSFRAELKAEILEVKRDIKEWINLNMETKDSRR